MARTSTAATLAARQEEQKKMAELMAKEPEIERETSYQEDNDNFDKIVIVRIPARFTEDKVKTLMGSMNAQLEGSGYRVIFVPEEVDVYFLGQDPPAKPRWV